MNERLKSAMAPWIAAAAAVSLSCCIVAPASAQMSPNPGMSPMPGMSPGGMGGGKGQCASDHNLTRVHRRLLGAIQQLSNDQKDYGGHRVAALNDLQAARTEIVAAESYAQTTYHEPAQCFNIQGVGTGGGEENGMRPQNHSNGNLTYVSNWIGTMIEHLQADQRDYGGHRDNAVKDMQQAQAELQQAKSTQ